MSRLRDTEPKDRIPLLDLQFLPIKFRWNAQEDLRSCFYDSISYLDNFFIPLPQIEKFKCASNHCVISKQLYNLYKETFSPFAIMIQLQSFLYYNLLMTHRSNQAGHFCNVRHSKYFIPIIESYIAHDSLTPMSPCTLEGWHAGFKTISRYMYSSE